MQQQANLERRGAQVVEQLPRRGPIEPFCRLHLDDDLVVDDKIQTLRRQLDALVVDAGGILTSDAMASRNELTLECLDVDVFEKSVSE